MSTATTSLLTTYTCSSGTTIMDVQTIPFTENTSSKVETVSRFTATAAMVAMLYQATDTSTAGQPITPGASTAPEASSSTSTDPHKGNSSVSSSTAIGVGVGVGVGGVMVLGAIVALIWWGRKRRKRTQYPENNVDTARFWQGNVRQVAGGEMEGQSQWPAEMQVHEDAQHKPPELLPGTPLIELQG